MYGQRLGGYVALVRGLVARNAGRRRCGAGEKALRVAGVVDVAIDVLILGGEDLGFARTMLAFGAAQLVLLVGVLQRERHSLQLIGQPLGVDFWRRGGGRHGLAGAVRWRANC